MSRNFQDECRKLSDEYRERFGENIDNPENLNAFVGAVVSLAPSARLQLSGSLLINSGFNAFHDRTCSLSLEEGSKMSVAEGTSQLFFDGDFRVLPGAEFSLGSGTYFNCGANVICHKKISIGADCAIAHRVTMEDGANEIVIGDHVWICNNAVIREGVHIGEHSIIAAGAEVTQDIPPHSMAAGRPAKVIRSGIDWNK